MKKPLDPNVVFALAKHELFIRQDPGSLGAYGTPPPDEQLDNLFRREWEDWGTAGGMKGIRPRNGPRDYPPFGGAARPPDEDD